MTAASGLEYYGIRMQNKNSLHAQLCRSVAAEEASENF